MILAGDIGGTKTVLTLAQKQADGALTEIREQTFKSQDFSHFEDLLNAFLQAGDAIESACFGIAGPVVNQRCQTTNLPWMIDGKVLQIRLGTTRVKLLNDLEAMALGMLKLPAEDLLELNPNAVQQTGNSAVIAAGTGLGEAILYWDGESHHPVATEGGHTDFAPQTDQQIALLHYLRGIYPDHVSYERLVSGIGFSHLYDFLLTQNIAPACGQVPDRSDAANDRNAVISQLGVSQKDPLCAAAVALFVDIYGAEAGNLALKSLAIGGIYIGGGIAPKILPVIQQGRFMQTFKAKGRFDNLLDQISVKVALNPRTPLLGALHYYS